MAKKVSAAQIIKEGNTSNKESLMKSKPEVKIGKSVSELTHIKASDIKDGKVIGKFNATDRKNSMEAMSAIANIALYREKEKEANKNKIQFTVDKDTTTMVVNGEEDKAVVLNNADMINK